MSYSRDLQALDGLRAIAVFLVIALHAHLPGLRGGFIGVDIFFVISGFLITWLLIREYDKHGSINLLHFYARRALRLFPALVVMLACIIGATALLQSRQELDSRITDAVLALFYLSNWSQALQWRPDNMLGHTWSLSIEEQFYFIWPFVLVLLLKLRVSRKRLAFLVFGIALTSSLWRLGLSFEASADRLYKGLDTRVDALLLGCAFGIIYASKITLPRLRQLRGFTFATPLAICGLFIAVYLARPASPFMFQFGYLLVALASLIVIADLALGASPWLTKPLSHSALTFTGRISYGLYLWHFPIFSLLEYQGLGRIGVLIFGSGITLVATLVSYYFVELPVLKHKARFAPQPSKIAPSKQQATTN